MIFNYDRKAQHPWSSVNLKQQLSDNFQKTSKTPNAPNVNQACLMSDYENDPYTPQVSGVFFLL